MTKIRFGILGSGYMGRTHAEAILQLGDRAALTAIAGGTRAAGLAQRYGIPEEGTAEALIRRPDVDAVVVTTPHHLHVEATVLALQAGKHALVEKPLATTVEDTTMALAEFSNGMVASLYSSRALPAANFPGESFRFRVVGSTGLIDLDAFDELRLADDQGWRVMSKQPPVGHASADTAFLESRMQAYRDQISSFITLIHGEQPAPDMPSVGTGDDGRAAVAACRAILTSSEQRRWVDLIPQTARPASTT